MEVSQSVTSMVPYFDGIERHQTDLIGWVC